MSDWRWDDDVVKSMGVLWLWMGGMGAYQEHERGEEEEPEIIRLAIGE